MIVKIGWTWIFGAPAMDMTKNHMTYQQVPNYSGGALSDLGAVYPKSHQHISIEDFQAGSDIFMGPPLQPSGPRQKLEPPCWQICFNQAIQISNLFLINLCSSWKYDPSGSWCIMTWSAKLCQSNGQSSGNMVGLCQIRMLRSLAQIQADCVPVSCWQ